MWVKQYYGGYATGIVVDSSDNIYVTGCNGSTGIATIKYDTTGNEMWVKYYNTGQCGGIDWTPYIAVDSLGNVAIAMTFNITSDTDYLVIKYDTDGNELWARQYNGGFDEWLYALTVGSSGNVYITGGTNTAGNTTGSGYDYATVKYDTNGNEVWVKRYDKQIADYALDIIVDSSGNIYVTGWSNGGSLESTYYVTIKYGANGNELWVKQHSGYYGWNSLPSLAIDSSGNVYVKGGIIGDTSQNLDYLLIKYDANGNEMWARQYDGGSSDYAAELAVDSSGGVYVTGIYWDENDNNYDYATIKYDMNGNEVWVKKYDGDGGDYKSVAALAIDSINNVYVTGSNYPENNYITIKYKQSPLTPSSLTSVINEMVSSGEITNSGLANSIISLLNNAQSVITANTTAAKNILEAAINKIEAQSGKQITTDAAEELIGYLNSIIDGI